MGGRRGPMHHSLTRHRNFSVLSNYLGITANESRSPFASAECRRRRRVYRPRVFRLYTRTYKDIPRPQRTHTNAIRVDSRSRRRRRHLAVVTNCSTVLFPSRPGIRRIAFQQLLNTPAEGKRGRTIGNREPISCPTLLSYPPPSLVLLALVVDVSCSPSVFFESASPTAWTRVFKRANDRNNEQRFLPTSFFAPTHAPALLASPSVDNFAFNLCNSGIGRERKDRGSSLLSCPRAYTAFRLFPSPFFPSLCVLSSPRTRTRTQQVKTTRFSTVRQPSAQWIGTRGPRFAFAMIDLRLLGQSFIFSAIRRLLVTLLRTDGTQDGVTNCPGVR